VTGGTPIAPRRDVLEVGPAGQGLLLTGQGLGALCSAFIIAALGDRLPKGRLMLIGVATYGVLELSFANSHWYALSVILMGLVGICHIAANVLIQTIVQGNAAPEMRGRMMGMFQQNQVFNMTGGRRAGAAASAAGAPLTVTLMGMACAAGALTIALAFPGARAIR
jgi:predicted MFS family arabinose efflux permease